MTTDTRHVVWFEELRRDDVPRVGGKNASLGELVSGLAARAIEVPPGFATTADAYWCFVEENGLNERIASTLADLKAGRMALPDTGQTIRSAFLRADWPKDFAGAITSAYAELCHRSDRPDADVAVRSSATAKDLPDASFVGQQETYLNIRGERALLDACRRCYASLFTDRAISYREAKGFDHLKVALSVGVQRMVRSDLGSAGVMFSIDTETGFDKVVLINAAWGLGESVVQDSVESDEYHVFKPLLSDPSLSPIVDRLARGLSRIAAAHHPKLVIVRMSDFKTNEYANLIDGVEFEPKEENPMLGFHGASRYYSPRYREGFALECRAIRRLREAMGFKNVVVMIPFCRSTKEADRVLEVMAGNGLRRGDDGLEVYVMCEIPSNVVLAKAFAERFDGFSIGSNDLTQLTLGVDRDSEELAELFDEQDEAVKWMIRTVIDAARRSGTKIGPCGQAPSDHPEFAEYLVQCGIDSLSVSPDSFIAVKQRVAAAESGN